MTLILRRPTPEDEGPMRALHAQLAEEGFDLVTDADRPWTEILAHWETERTQALPGRVTADYLVGEVDGVIVGRVSIRHELNDALREVGGHVGYAVGPEFRRRGYATAMLAQSLELLAARGVEQVLVTCDDTNLASAAVIERCGGVLEDITHPEGFAPKRRYWISTRG